MTGLFITLEGGEGAGKSTQIARLGERLRGLGRSVVTTREPGGSPRAEAIRESILAGHGKPFGPFAEALMFSAARLDHLKAVIRPALARGDIVLCDRFADSTRAYQGALGAVHDDVLVALEREVVGSTRPDLTLILDLPAEKGLARAAARRGGSASAPDRFEAENLFFHNKLRRAFKLIAKSEPDRCVVIDADRGADEVAEAIWEYVERLLGDDIKNDSQAHEIKENV
ncbi:MAG: dTMP kinase [Salinarimonadaceae bacterium]|nr:MAG: dTMP kinase [Salinarimonadaceae bacterium]